jgi:hypothetical protein
MNGMNSEITVGIDRFNLKMIALVLMTLDHLHQFFASNGIPIWFTWLGRLSAPLFFFTMAEGFFHTRNRITYIKRLYFFSVIMSLGKFVAWKISINNSSYPSVSNNIFETFFLIGFNILMFELLTQKDMVLLKKIMIIFIVVIFEIVFPISLFLLPNWWMSKIILSFFPCPLLCEGGFAFVSLGITFFYLRNDRKKMMIVYSIFSLLFVPFSQFSLQSAFYHDYQWMMIFSVPLMILYNGKRGYGLKYLFYLYYPAHIFIFFYISGIIK